MTNCYMWTLFYYTLFVKPETTGHDTTGSIVQTRELIYELQGSLLKIFIPRHQMVYEMMKDYSSDVSLSRIKIPQHQNEVDERKSEALTSNLKDVDDFPDGADNKGVI
ncbi:uncharacterized protein V6R79_021064 [Siganus canaliculatus]